MIRDSVFLVKAVGNCSSGRFVDDAESLQASDRPGVFGGLALSVVEGCWTATTAWVTFFPKYVSAASFIFVKTMAEISSGVYTNN